MGKRVVVVGLIQILVMSVLGATPIDSIGSASNTDTASILSRGINLDDVVVYGRHSSFGVASSQMSAISISKGQIMSVPVFLGEPDVLKSLQKFPGVQSSNDGTAGIFVRGGDYDQNYITLDGSALYNAEHMKGYVSAINPDVVQNINFYRGGFPARYGSRLSSVVDVGIKAGDFEHYRGLLSIGMLSSRAQIEGPIWKGHTSFNLAARLSYFDLIGKPVLKHYYDKPEALQPFENMKYYDLSAKLVHQFNQSHRLSAVVYYGEDKDDNAPTKSSKESSTLDNNLIFYERQSAQEEHRSSSTVNNWSNLVSSLYWTAFLSDRFKLNTNLSFSRYAYCLSYDNFFDHRVTDHYRQYYYHTETSAITYKNDISDLALAIDADYKLNSRHYLRSGFRLSAQKLTPEADIYRDLFTKRYNGSLNEIQTVPPVPEYIITVDTVDYISNGAMTIKNAALYIEDDFSFTKRFKLNMGIRAAAYFVTDKSYFSLEPRAALRYLVTDNASLKLSYSRMAQGIHRLVSGNLVMASDIWVPITKDFPLMTSDLYGVAFNYDLPLKMSLSVEGYYKTMENVLEYRNAASYTLSEGDWQDMVAIGKGRSFGVELLLERTMGKTTGWISYTWSKALRTFDRPGQEIDGGREFYANTDMRHNLSATVSHHFTLSKKIGLDLTASWTYQSGRRGTIPYSYIFGYYIHEFENLVKYNNDQDVWNLYGHESDVFETAFGNYTGAPFPLYTYKSRNDLLLPPIHHFDLSCNLSFNYRLGITSFGISLYNVYNRKNVSNVYVGYEENVIVLKGICPFPFMPSLIITHKF